MNIDEIILTDEQKAQLDMLSEQYRDASDEFTVCETKKNALNAVIKNMLDSFGVMKYESDSGLSLSMTKRPNIKWDEDKLLAFCRTLGIPDLIKTREYVDMEALEAAIYRGQVTAESLKPMQIVKPDIVTLRLTQKKQLNE